MAATAWPTTSTRGPEHEPTDGTVSREDPRLSGARWMLLWAKDPLGECCCPRGTVRSGDGVANPGGCTSIGKHPWMTRVNGELVGFAHGSADAMEIGQLVQTWGAPGGVRQLGTTLADLLVIDLDNERAVRDFARCWFTVLAAPRERLLGVSKSPRGYHVWLSVPGWTQQALNAWMAQWLINWHGTDTAKAGRRGFCFDVRTGEKRYVVWPGSTPERRWMAPQEFAELMRAQLVGMPAWRMAPTNVKAPWAVDTDSDSVAAFMDTWTTNSAAEIETEGYEFDGSVTDLDRSWAELERWIERLEAMPPGSGRNNALNAVAFYSGSVAVMTGHSYEQVFDTLVAAAERIGSHGVRDTVASGMRSGLSALKSQVKG